ncbi:hypothetical protein, partial [Poseidonocella sp. HB161398]|uniref:hypothetical protein n=1 Tax=Poseidonocella sp. HB161398 TaxID=2320855 RepID=UPI00198102D2
LVLRRGPTAHAYRLSCWIHAVNPSHDLCNKADQLEKLALGRKHVEAYTGSLDKQKDAILKMKSLDSKVAFAVEDQLTLVEVECDSIVGFLEDGTKTFSDILKKVSGSEL